MPSVRAVRIRRREQIASHIGIDFGFGGQVAIRGDYAQDVGKCLVEWR